MEHLLNDEQRQAYQAFAMNHSHHGGWRPLHADAGTAVSTCSTCQASFGLGPIEGLDVVDRPAILVIPDALLAGLTHEKAQDLLDDPSMAFSAGVRWAAHGGLPVAMLDEARDNLYGVLHAIRETLCLAQHHVPPGQSERIDRLIRDVDRIGSTYSLLGQWNETNRTHLDPELPDQVRLEMSRARSAEWARRKLALDQFAATWSLLTDLTQAVAASNFAVTPEVNTVAQQATRHLAAIEGSRLAAVVTAPPGSTAALYQEIREAEATGNLVATPTSAEELVGSTPAVADQALADLDAGISFQVQVMHLALNDALDTIDGAYTGLAASKVVRALLALGWELEPVVVDGKADSGPELAEAYVEVRRDPAEDLGYRRMESIRLAVQLAGSGACPVDPIKYARQIDAYRDGPAEPGAWLDLSTLEQLTAHLQGQAQDVTHEAHEALVVARAQARQAADAGSDTTERV